MNRTGNFCAEPNRTELSLSNFKFGRTEPNRTSELWVQAEPNSSAEYFGRTEPNPNRTFTNRISRNRKYIAHLLPLLATQVWNWYYIRPLVRSPKSERRSTRSSENLSGAHYCKALSLKKVSGGQLALTGEIMSGARLSAHFPERERRSTRAQKIWAPLTKALALSNICNMYRCSIEYRLYERDSI